MPNHRHDAGHAFVGSDAGGDPVQLQGLHAPIQGGHHVEVADGRIVLPEARVCHEHHEKNRNRGGGHSEKGIGGTCHPGPGYLRPGPVGEQPAREGYRDPGQSLQADDGRSSPATINHTDKVKLSLISEAATMAAGPASTPTAER